MDFLGILVALLTVILIRFMAGKITSVLTGSFRISIALGWIGGIIGGLIFDLGPHIGFLDLLGAFIGCILILLVYGIYPFLKILLRG
jgi:uncharacterized membrane protein YeaQ/YmgE (transglycosylase-associated protein family)